MKKTSVERSRALSLDEILNEWLQMRIQAIHSMLWILDLSDQFGDDASIQVRIKAGPTIESTLPFLSSPIIAAGYVHSRAVLEFLGITTKDGKLVRVGSRHKTDVAIEHYSIDGVFLQMVSLDDVYAAINMPTSIAEWALVTIVESANKFYAHVTKGEVLTMAMQHQVKLALDGILILLNNHLFAKLNRSEPIIVEKGSIYSCNTCEQKCTSKTAPQS